MKIYSISFVIALSLHLSLGLLFFSSTSRQFAGISDDSKVAMLWQSGDAAHSEPESPDEESIEQSTSILKAKKSNRLSKPHIRSNSESGRNSLEGKTSIPATTANVRVPRAMLDGNDKRTQGTANTIAATGQTAAGSQGVKSGTAYRGQVLAHLERFKTYPREARIRRLEAELALSLTLASDGAVLDKEIQIVRGSRLFLLATQKMLQRAVPFPPTPSNKSETMSIPIRYVLD